MRVFNKHCGLNVQVVLPVQVKHVTAVLQDDVQGIGGLLLVGVRDHSERQPGGWRWMTQSRSGTKKVSRAD